MVTYFYLNVVLNVELLVVVFSQCGIVLLLKIRIWIFLYFDRLRLDT